MSRIGIFFIFLMNFYFLSSQNNANKDSTSLISYTDKIIIKANLETQSASYSIIPEDDSYVLLSSNDKFRLTLSLDYEFIGVSFGFSPKFFSENKDNELKGESSFTDYGFRFFLGNWTQELEYKKVQGFYIENTDDFIPNWINGQDAYIQFPDFKTIFWGGSTSYVLNPNFSLRNVVYNTEWQRKSAGSFIPTLRYGYTHLSAIFSDSKDYLNSFDIRLAPEYYFTLVIHENWFISPYLSPSFGIRFSTEGSQDSQKKEKNIYWPTSIDGGLQLGYSSGRVIFGANFNFESIWYNEGNQNIFNDKTHTKLYLGFRFDSPKPVKKLFNRIK